MNRAKKRIAKVGLHTRSLFTTNGPRCRMHRGPSLPNIYYPISIYAATNSPRMDSSSSALCSSRNCLVYSS